MKTKKFNKLSLNKQTVASLNSSKMNAINGGASEDTNCIIDPEMLHWLHELPKYLRTFRCPDPYPTMDVTILCPTEICPGKTATRRY